MLVSRFRTIERSCGLCCRRIGYFWGHTTQEEIEAERKRIQDGPVMAWQNPETELLGIEKTASYVPMRVAREEKATFTTYDLKRYNMADHYGFLNHPHGLYGYLKHPEHYFPNQGIRAYQRLVMSQKFVGERVLALGPDLAAAIFLINRNLRVKFKDRPAWISGNSMIKSKVGIPVSWQPGWYVEAIDASCSNLVYEGFNNLRNLIFLKSLDVSYCPEIDDWCLDRITGEYQDSLEELDLSGCKKVSLTGLEVVWRLRKLKVLKLKDMDHIADLRLVCLMLLDEFPHLRIVGVDYEDTKLLEGTEHQHLVKDYESMLLNSGQLAEKELPRESMLSPAPPFENQDEAGSKEESKSEHPHDDIQVNRHN